VVCILHRRYRPPLKREPWGDQSPTEAEVRRQNIGAREAGVLLRPRRGPARLSGSEASPGAAMRWVEPGKPEQGARWVRFTQYAIDLPEHCGRSNWCDQFRTVIELKPMVVKRLMGQLPRQSVALAMRPDRFVRMTFVPSPGQREHVYGWFENVGAGAAINLRYGVAPLPLSEVNEVRHRGGLAESQAINSSDGRPLTLMCKSVTPHQVIVCEYEIRFGDRYRVEQVDTRQETKTCLAGRKRLQVGLPGEGGAVRWIEVG
jgi:hypothetical protein